MGVPLSKWGASRDEWKLFSGTLGQRKNLLPVLSNLDAVISPDSRMKKVGKTPSVYNHRRQAVGLTNWTNMEASVEQVKQWASEPDYGICLICREVKAIDVDVTNPGLAAKARDLIEDYLFDIGIFDPPVRSRGDSSKFLVALRVPSAPAWKKDVAKMEGEHIIEMLSSKQQFIAAGTNPDGAKYEWENLSAETGIPVISEEHFLELWQLMKDTFAIDPTPGVKLMDDPFSLDEDPVYQALADRNMIRDAGSVTGSFNIVCPFGEEHTEVGGEGDSSTTFFPAHTGGHAHASIVCLHAHCQERSTETFKRALGFTGAEDFEDLDALENSDGLADIVPLSEPQKKLLAKKKQFVSEECFDFCASFADINWLVKQLIPSNSIGAILGPPGAGKSFVTFDIAAAIARGVVWQGKKTKKGRVLYICAEGATMFKLRGKAYMVEHKIESSAELPISIVPANPNLADEKEVKVFIEAIKAQHGDEEISLIIFDTYAACMIGDENSSKDTGLMIRGLQEVKDAFNTTVLVVHHTGKTAGMGARGHSSLPAAFDFELSVARLKHKSGSSDLQTQTRELRISKMKDAPDEFRCQFKLKRVLLGVDEDLEEISSCVIGVLSEEELEEAESYEEEVVSGPDAKGKVVLGRSQQRILEIVKEYKAGGPGLWPVGDVLLKEIHDKTEGGYLKKKSQAKKVLKSMVEVSGVLRVDRDDRYIITSIEPLTDENAVHDPLSVEDDFGEMVPA